MTAFAGFAAPPGGTEADDACVHVRSLIELLSKQNPDLVGLRNMIGKCNFALAKLMIAPMIDETAGEVLTVYPVSLLATRIS